MKDTKERLFEVMKAVNPDFRKPINELFNGNQQPLENQNYQLKTYGDLKRIINVIKLKQKGSKLAGVGFDMLVGAIPFLSTAKDAFDVYKAAFGRNDTKKTNTWLDKLDIDDETSAIVDDSVENGFIRAMSDRFNAEPDEKILEPDFNMNTEMINYLSDNYKQRTVSGIPTV